MVVKGTCSVIVGSKDNIATQGKSERFFVTKVMK